MKNHQTIILFFALLFGMHCFGQSGSTGLIQYPPFSPSPQTGCAIMSGYRNQGYPINVSPPGSSGFACSMFYKCTQDAYMKWCECRFVNPVPLLRGIKEQCHQLDYVSISLLLGDIQDLNEDKCKKQIASEVRSCLTTYLYPGGGQ